MRSFPVGVAPKNSNRSLAFQPRSLQSLLQIYDQNYSLMLKLLPVLAAQQQRELHLPAARQLKSMVDGEPDLHIQILEQAPYTTTLHMTYWFEQGATAAIQGQDERLADPDLQVRIYHDARQVECLRCGHNAHFEILQQFKGPAATVLERRWQLNGMLNKWLHYCLAQGHQFPTMI